MFQVFTNNVKQWGSEYCAALRGTITYSFPNQIFFIPTVLQTELGISGQEKCDGVKSLRREKKNGGKSEPDPEKHSILVRYSNFSCSMGGGRGVDPCPSQH